jgi:hypothetical protein
VFSPDTDFDPHAERPVASAFQLTTEPQRASTCQAMQFSRPGSVVRSEITVIFHKSQHFHHHSRRPDGLSLTHVAAAGNPTA